MKRRKEGITTKKGMKDDFPKQRLKGLKRHLAEDHIKNAKAKSKVEQERQEMFDAWNAEVLILRQEEE